MFRNITLSEICNKFSLSFIGDDVVLKSLNVCYLPSEYNSVLAYVSSDKFLKKILENTSISVLLVREDDFPAYSGMSDKRKISFVISPDPEKLFYDIYMWLSKETDFYCEPSISSIASSAKIHTSAVIEDGVIIGENVCIGANTVIMAGTVIKDRCRIGSNSTIGSDGFQIRKIDGEFIRIPHSGKVVLEENVDIGDNTCVCRSLFEGCTHIGKNSKIDNLVHIAHNVSIEENVIVTAGVILTGGVSIEENAYIGVGASIRNLVTVEKGALVGMGAIVLKNVKENTTVVGNPARKIRECDL